MSARSVLARGRQAAERLMTDTCLIRRPVGETTDDDGDVTTTHEPDAVYEGPCRFQVRSTAETTRDVGEQRVDLLTGELQLPIDATGVRVNDDIECLTSLDPDLVGLHLRVANRMHKTHATSRRLPVDEITS